MSLFDSIISEADEKFGLGNKAETLLSALLSLITDQERGGFGGFLDRFSKAGLGDVVASWISTGANSGLSEEQVESALGTEAIAGMANQAEIDEPTAKAALGYIIPNVVDKLTPDGLVPEEKDLLTKIGGFLSGMGGAIAGGVGVVASSATDKVGDVADAGKAVVGKGVEVVGRGIDRIDAAAGTVGDTAGNALNAVGDGFDGDGGGILKWLLPLILLGLMLLLGFWFCSKPPAPTLPASNANTTANKTGNANSTAKVVESNSSIINATTEVARKLTEVSLPDGTKLQAYPGGIEDQLVKFIQSDDYKNGTADSLKDKWFNFDDLNFKTGTAELMPASKRQLDNIVAILKAFPDTKIKVGAYTDKTGNDDANLKLSDERAKTVKDALEKAGVNAVQVPEAEGYGSKFAEVPATASDKEREKDRKTSVRLLK